MTLQNRVDPFGVLHADPAKGALMGNRGILHHGQEIRHRWKAQAWVTCRLDVPGVKRKPFSDGTYSELFFLDEATAFAAGHRPCNHCRSERFKEFKEAWFAANRASTSPNGASIGEVDRVLHSERALSGHGDKVRVLRFLGELPLGVMVEYAGRAHLIWRQRLRPWTFGGYGEPVTGPGPSTQVNVITPESIVRIFAGGFVPQVHVSAYS